MTDSDDHLNRSATVRRAVPADARLLAQLGARLFAQTFAEANTPEDMRAYLADAFTVERLLVELDDPNDVIWIAEDAGGAAVGYAAMYRGSRGDGVSAKTPAEVRRIYVDQPWHGRRVGETLMRSCVEQARSWHCDALWLAVWEKNPRAIAFYEKSGFRRVGAQLFMLGQDRQNDYVMLLPLD